MTNLFVFGTLLDKRIEKEVFSDMPVQQTDELLLGYRLVSVDISRTETDYRTIVPATNHIVHGRVLQISKRDLDEADRWENNYTRQLFVLSTGIIAWAYVMKPSVYNRAIGRRDIAD